MEGCGGMRPGNPLAIPRPANPPRPAPSLDNVRRLSYYGHMAIKTERISVRFGPELLDAAEKAAYDQEMALGEWIRYAVAEYLRLSTKEEA